MKKKIIIYLIGVVLGWSLGFKIINDLNKELDTPLTYGDVGFVTVMSTLSWVNVVVTIVVMVSESDIWDQPISPNQPVAVKV